MSTLRVPFADLESALHRATLGLGLTGERAALCARLFAETTRDGVYTHGLNRFPRFAQMVANGQVDVNGEAERVGGTAVLERWDGRRGPGNLNAYAAMQRAIALAQQNGLGAETPSQLLLFLLAANLGGTSRGFIGLLAFIVGLLIMNTLMTASASGIFAGSTNRPRVQSIVTSLTAIYSFVIGFIFLLGSSAKLPPLPSLLH